MQAAASGRQLLEYSKPLGEGLGSVKSVQNILKRKDLQPKMAEAAWMPGTKTGSALSVTAALTVRPTVPAEVSGCW